MKSRFVFAALLAVAAPLYAEPAARPAGVPGLPASWQIGIDPDDMDSFLAPALESDSGVMPQQMQNRYLGMLATVWDAKLLTTYLKVLASLDGAGQVSLCREQTAWLKKRERAAHQAEEAEEGGSLAPASYSREFIDLTKQRDTELANRLANRLLIRPVHAGKAAGTATDR